MILAVGIAVLIAIPILIAVRNSPKWEPSIADLEISRRESPAVAPESHDPVSLPNGTDLISPPATEGLGKLKISNYTQQDAAVKLKTEAGKETLRFVYLRAMSDLTIPKIPVGTYVLEFATGRDWDVASGVLSPGSCIFEIRRTVRVLGIKRRQGNNVLHQQRHPARRGERYGADEHDFG